MRDKHEIRVPNQIREQYPPWSWCASQLVHKDSLSRCVTYIKTIRFTDHEVSLYTVNVGGMVWYATLLDDEDYLELDQPVKEFRYRYRQKKGFRPNG